MPLMFCSQSILMKYIRKYYIVLALLLIGLCASCSSMSMRMPVHRKKRHCDCPTFSENFISKPPIGFGYTTLKSGAEQMGNTDMLADSFTNEKT